MNIVIFFVPGDPVHLHSDQSLCVLPAGGGNHSAHVPSGAAIRKIFDLRHDIGIYKVTHKPRQHLKRDK